MVSGDVRYILFYSVFAFLLATTVTLADVSDIQGLEGIGEPSADLFSAGIKFFFLTINPFSPLYPISFIFWAMTIPLIYIVVNLIPFVGS